MLHPILCQEEKETRVKMQGNSRKARKGNNNSEHGVACTLSKFVWPGLKTITLLPSLSRWEYSPVTPASSTCLMELGRILLNSFLFLSSAFISKYLWIRVNVFSWSKQEALKKRKRYASSVWKNDTESS
jgi:hypothetical protein